MNLLYRRVAHYSLTNILRNKLLSIGTILVIAVVVFFLNVLEGAFFISQQSIATLNQKIDFNVELRDGVDTDSILVDNLVAELARLGIVVEKVSRQKALETFESVRPEFSSFRTKHNLENPLPASLYLTEVGSELFETVKSILDLPAYQEIVNRDINTSLVALQEEKIGKWSNIIRFVETALHAMRFAFYLVAVLIIVSTIRIIILSREKEIDIMELVGAPFATMRVPFVLEGVMYSVVGVLLGLFLYNTFLSGLYGQMIQGDIDPFLLELLTSLHSYFQTNVFRVFGGQALLFVLIGGLGSYLAVAHFFFVREMARKHVG